MKQLLGATDPWVRLLVGRATQGGRVWCNPHGAAQQAGRDHVRPLRSSYRTGCWPITRRKLVAPASCHHLLTPGLLDPRLRVCGGVRGRTRLWNRQPALGRAPADRPHPRLGPRVPAPRAPLPGPTTPPRGRGLMVHRASEGEARDGAKPKVSRVGGDRLRRPPGRQLWCDWAGGLPTDSQRPPPSRRPTPECNRAGRTP